MTIVASARSTSSELSFPDTRASNKNLGCLGKGGGFTPINSACSGFNLASAEVLRLGADTPAPVTPRTEGVFSPAPDLPITPDPTIERERQVEKTAERINDLYIKCFSDKEKLEAETYFSTSFREQVPGIVDFIEKELKIAGKKEKQKMAYISCFPFAKGGNAALFFGVVRGKKGNLKYRAFRCTDRSYKQNPIEYKLSCVDKRKRVTQKVWTTDQLNVRVLELANKGDLLQFMRKNPEVDRLPFAYRIIHSYFTFHLEGFVHLDLKAQNFLVHETEKGIEVRLSDLDTARVYQPGQKETLRVGTPLYWPKDSQNVDLFAADCYALGVTILDIYAPQLLDQIKPFDAPAYIQEWKAAIRGFIPPILQPFLFKCLDQHNGVTKEDFNQVLALLYNYLKRHS